MSLFPSHILTRKTITILAISSAIYLAVVGLLVGLKPENFVIVAAYNFFFLCSESTRKFVAAFSIFIVFGIVYDLMKAFPNYLFNSVDIKQVYNFEKTLFGIKTATGLMTPNEFFAAHHTVFLDLLSGFFYINWMPIPLALGFYFFLKNKEQYLHFSLTFLFTNLIGFSLYYIHPAAPPWYIAQYGNAVSFSIPGNPAGLIHFDKLLHVSVFESIYSRNSNVFAAMPSLHSAYPVIVLFYAIKSKLGWINIFFGIFVLGIWFSAIYSGHHYAVDVIAGALTAIMGISIYQRFLIKIPKVNSWISAYKENI